MTVVLPRGLEKKISDLQKIKGKISDLQKIKGKGWDKELERAIDAILAEDLLLTPNPKQKLTEAQAIKEASKAVKQHRARTN